MSRYLSTLQFVQTDLRPADGLSSRWQSKTSCRCSAACAGQPARREIIGVGHRVHADQTEAFLAAVLPFLTQEVPFKDQMSGICAVTHPP